MTEAKIVIYMSCYNHEKYVAEAMNSILGQTYKNWELYVVNDASTDRTGEILASYQDVRIHYYDFRENTRFVGAANFLQFQIQNIDADYIAAMSSDDKWELDKLEKQVDILTKHPEYKACFTWDKIIFDQKEGVYMGREDYSHIDNRSRYDWIAHFFYNGNCLNACSVLMDKEVFYELGRVNEIFLQLGDFRLWFKTVCQYPIYILCEELTYYRRHGSNLSEMSIDGNIRTAYEWYWILYEVIKSMPASVFYRTFYNRLPYVWDGSKEDLWAAKYILLAEISGIYNEQAAINFFFEHCDSERFIRILEDKYYYKAQDFLTLTSFGGLQYSLENICEPVLPERKKKRIASAGEMLINNLLSGDQEESLKILRYSALLEFYAIAKQAQQLRSFEEIKAIIDQVRSQRKEKMGHRGRREWILIAEESAWDAETGVKEMQEKYPETEFLISFLPTKKAGLSLSYTGVTKKGTFSDESREVLVFYDKEEHCLHFPGELDEKADAIWYVDCLGSDYECEDMIAAYPLVIEQNCILNESVCHALEREDARSLHVANRVQIYRCDEGEKEE